MILSPGAPDTPNFKLSASRPRNYSGPCEPSHHLPLREHEAVKWNTTTSLFLLTAHFAYLREARTVDVEGYTFLIWSSPTKEQPILYSGKWLFGYICSPLSNCTDSMLESWVTMLYSGSLLLSIDTPPRSRAYFQGLFISIILACRVDGLYFRIIGLI